MVLWMLLALMTGAAVLSVLWPLSRRTVMVEPDSDVPFYKAQLAEIERDRERGILDGEAVVGARIEAGRRLIKAAAKAPDILDATSEPALRRRRAASALALSVVPIIGLAIYGDLGSPKLLARPGPSEASASTAGQEQLSAALRRVEDHLAAQPDDVRGWDVLAPIYLRAGRLDDAARAFRRARALGGDTVERLLGEGEALVGAGGGVIDAEAGQLFRRVVEIDAASPAGRYYVALTAEQGGDAAAARAGYRSLLETSRPDAPWLPLVSARLARLEGAGEAARIAPGSVPPEVAAMVTGLDERLRAGGGNAAEWSRLVRSFVVLGRREDALDRLEKARVALADDRDGVHGLDELARELGLRAEVARQ